MERDLCIRQMKLVAAQAVGRSRSALKHATGMHDETRPPLSARLERGIDVCLFAKKEQASLSRATQNRNAMQSVFADGDH